MAEVEIRCRPKNHKSGDENYDENNRDLNHF